jgi:hypothetical protein
MVVYIQIEHTPCCTLHVHDNDNHLNLRPGNYDVLIQDATSIPIGQVLNMAENSPITNGFRSKSGNKMQRVFPLVRF